MSASLSDAIPEYLDSRRARGIAPGTLKIEKTILRQLLTVTGNILVKNLDSRHIDMYFSAYALAPSTWNRNMGFLSSFFKWCRARKYATRDFDPLEGIKLRKVAPRDVIILPKERFTELLDAAPSGRDRIVCSIGLFSFQRASEINRLRWSDVQDTSDNPKLWRLAIYRQKTKDRDWLPLSSNLRKELVRWKMEYGRLMGEVPHDDWYITPSYHQGEWRQDAQGRLQLAAPLKLNPTAQYRKPHEAVQRVLAAIGYENLKYEGAHTLRRSGGRALYDELAWGRGHDAAMRVVQSMYGHANLTTTERYIRVELERKRRDDLIAGQEMFPTRTADVVPLSAVEN